MRVLADTSVWVSYLREGTSGPSGQLDRLLDDGRVVMCGPVAAEILAGTGEVDREKLWSLLFGLPWADLGVHEWRRVGDTAASLRRAGLSLPLTDIEIAVAAVASESALWSRDADFDRIHGVLPELTRWKPESVESAEPRPVEPGPVERGTD